MNIHSFTTYSSVAMMRRMTIKNTKIDILSIVALAGFTVFLLAPVLGA